MRNNDGIVIDRALAVGNIGDQKDDDREDGNPELRLSYATNCRYFVRSVKRIAAVIGKWSDG